MASRFLKRDEQLEALLRITLRQSASVKISRCLNSQKDLWGFSFYQMALLFIGVF